MEENVVNISCRCGAKIEVEGSKEFIDDMIDKFYSVHNCNQQFVWYHIDQCNGCIRKGYCFTTIDCCGGPYYEYTYTQPSCASSGSIT